MPIEIYPLGAGQEVGRSCIIINIEDKTIMLDCGLHMTHHDHRRFPDFKKIPPNTTGISKVDLVLITHFHLDHCGALPFFTEFHGYDGPIVMTMPTKALLPYMLEDYRKVWSDTQGGGNNNQKSQQQNQQQLQDQQPNNSDPLMIFNQEEIKQCIDKISLINVMETQIHNDIEIKAYYAGHLLGACMFYIKYKGYSVVYTGDFNSLSDRHLGAAYIDRLEPDLLISESTYATTIRDTKRTRERNFLMHIQETLDNGGKVLIPCFALGRSQELSVLLDTYWERTQLKYGLYFAAGLIEKANQYYKLFVNWESEKIQNSFQSQNIFDFKHIRPFDRQLIKSQDPMVLLATPGMLHGGLSMQVFKEWCSGEKNSLIVPGYCVAGTLGNKLLSGAKKVKIDNKEYEVLMNVQNMSFSAHADSKGIIQLIKHLQPKNVMFVHGEAQKMKTLGKIIEENLQIPVYCPENFSLCKIDIKPIIMPQIQMKLDEYTLTLLKNQNKIQGFIIESPYSQKISFVSSYEQLVNETMSIISQITGGVKPQLICFKNYLIAQNKSQIAIPKLLDDLKAKDLYYQELKLDPHSGTVWIYFRYLKTNKQNTAMAHQIKKYIELL